MPVERNPRSDGSALANPARRVQRVLEPGARLVTGRLGGVNLLLGGGERGVRVERGGNRVAGGRSWLVVLRSGEGERVEQLAVVDADGAADAVGG